MRSSSTRLIHPLRKFDEQKPLLFGVLALTLLLVMAGCGDDGPTAGGSETDAITAEDTGSVTTDIGDQDATGTDAGEAPGDTAGDSGTAISTDTSDGGAGDTGVGSDTADGGENCQGTAGCACAKNNDCDNGICLDTPGGKKCAKTCVDSCPDAYSCKQFGGNDSVFVCTPNHLTLCAPCEANSDCQVYGKESLCLSYGDGGSFCGSACAKDSDCPSKYACVDAFDKDTKKASKQCKLKEKTTGAATCACTVWAKTAATKTTCSNGSDSGVCTGTRSCGDKGLTACDAPTAVTETCNDVDDDCDGVTDELPKTATCSNKAWSSQGSGTACTSDKACTKAGESCDTTQKTCQILIGECSGVPVCLPGGKMECKNAKMPKIELCNGEDDDCDGGVDEDFAWTDPATQKPVAVGAACGAGACAGGTVKCQTFSAATCDSAGKAGKETCSGADDDCDGKTDEDTCDDGDACTKDVCDGQKKSCAHLVGKGCDDANACTVDSCDKASGKCINKAYVGSCDDGDACTVGDVCDVDKAGVSACKAGGKAKSCEDNNICTDDSCDKTKGCLNLPNAATQSCYDGGAGTLGVGPCKKGVQFCKNGTLTAVCIGAVLPNKTELCDNIDDNCNGKTDESCAVVKASLGFASAAGELAGAKGTKLRFALGQESPTGTASGKKNTVLFGFWAWLTAGGK